jgi:nucleotide-binding universal stress UspA family protein
MFPTKIMPAIDSSEEAGAAARAAVQISNSTGSELHTVFALRTDPQAPYPHPLMGERWDSIIEQAKHDARKFVDRKAGEVEAMGGKAKDAHLAFGKPDQEIVRLGEELEAGMIVVGSRGLGGLDRALLGSVSDSVVRHAQGPVLAVRSEERRPEAGARTAEGRGRV